MGREKPNSTVPDAEGYHPDWREVYRFMQSMRLLKLTVVFMLELPLKLVLSGAVLEVEEGKAVCLISDIGDPF